MKDFLKRIEASVMNVEDLAKSKEKKVEIEILRKKIDNFMVNYPHINRLHFNQEEGDSINHFLLQTLKINDTMWGKYFEERFKKDQKAPDKNEEKMKIANFLLEDTKKERQPFGRCNIEWTKNKNGETKVRIEQDPLEMMAKLFGFPNI